MFTRSRFISLIFLFVTFGAQLEARVLPTKEDCADLWNLMAKQGNAIGSLRKVQNKAMDAGTIVRLYEDCLRSEEGIRYRRSGPPGFWLDQAVMQAIDLQHPNSPQITSLAPAKSESDNQLIAKLKAIVSRM